MTSVAAPMIISVILVWNTMSFATTVEIRGQSYEWLMY